MSSIPTYVHERLGADKSRWVLLMYYQTNTQESPRYLFTYTNSDGVRASFFYIYWGFLFFFEVYTPGQPKAMRRHIYLGNCIYKLRFAWHILGSTEKL